MLQEGNSQLFLIYINCFLISNADIIMKKYKVNRISDTDITTM